MTPEARALFLKIARCSVMVDTLNGKETRWGKVVLCQTALKPPVPVAAWRRKHHLPDPWVGHIEQAPLLFLSSNPFVRRKPPYDDAPVNTPPRSLPAFNGVTLEEHPSLGRAFEAPKAEWDDDQLVDKGESMWEVWTEETGTAPYVDEERSLDPPSPYWRAAHQLANTFLERAARPGYDYALTEIVRCKSPEEIGVDQAADECVSRYLDATLALSPAPVIAVLGRRARQAVRKITGFAENGPVTPPYDVGGRDRVFAFLGHPSAANPRYPKALDPESLAVVRELLSTYERGRRYTWEAGDVEITRLPGGEE